MKPALALLLVTLAGHAAYGDTLLTVGRPTLATPLPPMRVTVPAGERVELVFPALSGNQWLKNGLPIPGANGRTFVIPSAQVSDTGSYRVYYTSAHPIDSQDVVIRVVPSGDAANGAAPAASEASFLTLTSRGIAGTGAQSLVAGFIVSEASSNPFISQKVLVRAVGPTLSSFDVTGFLKRPKLTVHDANGQLCASLPLDAATLTSIEQRVGAFPLRLGAGDSVQLLALSPGPYTAQVTSDDGVSGLCLLEVYQVPAGF